MKILAASIMEAWTKEVQENQDENLKAWVKTPQFTFWFYVMAGGDKEKTSA